MDRGGFGPDHRGDRGPPSRAGDQDEPCCDLPILAKARADTKKKTIRAVEQTREDVAEARGEWRDGQRKLKLEQLVFVDETWTSTNMVPRYGRGPKGKRVEGSAPHGHWLTTTFMAALRHDRIDAPCVFDGPINGDCFKAWTTQQLAPTLRPGDIVIVDNLSSHKVAGVKETIEACGATLLYLPPYSPDLNPIEQVFAKLKHLLRKARPRTAENLNKVIGRLLDLFSSGECRNYIRNAGYGSI